MKDKLENLLQLVMTVLVALITGLCSVTLFGAGIDMINKPNNFDVLVGTIMAMLSVAIGVFGVVLTLFYIKSRKN